MELIYCKCVSNSCLLDSRFDQDTIPGTCKCAEGLYLLRGDFLRVFTSCWVGPAISEYFLYLSGKLVTVMEGLHMR